MNAHIPVDSKTDLRAIAIAAFEVTQKNHEIHTREENDARSQKAFARFVDWFGIDPDHVDGFLVTSGDVQLLYIPESWSADFGQQNEGWRVVGLCHRCDESVLSPWCGDLESIGKYLKEFKPDWTHQCRLPKVEIEKQPSLEERLISTLRDLIRDELAVAQSA